MPKSTNPLTQKQLERAREIHEEVLNENTTLKDIVDNATSGKTGSDKQRAWATVVKIIFQRNRLYREAVRARFQAAGIPTIRP